MSVDQAMSVGALQIILPVTVSAISIALLRFTTKANRLVMNSLIMGSASGVITTILEIVIQVQPQDYGWMVILGPLLLFVNMFACTIICFLIEIVIALSGRDSDAT